MKKSTMAGIAAVSVAGALALGLGAVTDWYTNWNAKTWFGRNGGTQSQKAEDIAADLDITPDAGNEVIALSVKRLNGANTLTAVQSDDGIAVQAATPSYNITATITGNGVSNPKLDWTVEKSDNFSSGSTNPVTVTPTSDGALTATVSCSAAFSGTVIIRATLRDVGSSATCTVLFEGIPSSMSVGSSTLTKSGDYYNANALTSYTVDTKLTNVYNSVGSKYSDYAMTVEKFGTIKCDIANYVAIMGGYLPSGKTTEVSFSEADGYASFMTFSLSGNRVTVNVNKSLSAYRYSTTSAAGDRSEQTFNSVVSTCYYLVTVREKTSGLSTSFKVGFSAGMQTTVSLSSAELTF